MPGWDREISCGTAPPDAGQLAARSATMSVIFN